VTASRSGVRLVASGGVFLMSLSHYDSAFETANTLSEFLHKDLEALCPERHYTYEELVEKIRVLSRLVMNSGPLEPEQAGMLLERLRQNPLIIPVPGGRIRLDFEILRDLTTIAAGGWEIRNLILMQQLLHPGRIVLDIGAHVGHFTILAASTVGAGGEVYAFEPAPSNYQRLRENLRLNAFAAHVEAVPIAVSDRLGTAGFFDDGRTGGTEYSMFSSRHGKHGVAFSAPTEPLDHFAEKHGLPSVDFIKIDTEGAELAVLCGADNILRKNPHILLLIELHPWVVAPEAVCAHLERYQMRLYDIDHGLSMFSPEEATHRFPHGGDILATRAKVNVVAGS